jgi:hypothetical protein
MSRIARIGVTGGRDYTDKEVVYKALDSTLNNVKSKGLEMYLVVGDADGADALARSWAKERGIDHKEGGFVADWEKHGKSAGPIRNREMLKSGIDKLCAFPGGRGTSDMMNICYKAKILVRVYL